MPTKKPTKSRSPAYRDRLKASGEPPAWAVANALMAVVIEAQLNNDAEIPFDKIINRAADIIDSDPRYKRAAVFTVMSRFTRPRTRRPRSW
jgi:hypothetical protein